MERHLYRALIVDDDPAIRESVARAMAAHSFWCDTAGDGQEALAKYRENRHDLVVADLRMAKMHGYALSLELLKDAQPPRIVILTGLAEPTLLKDLYSRGVDDIVTKPVDVRVFALKMAALFERKVWRAELRAKDQEWRNATGHTLIAKIENALESASLIPPASLDEIFETAANELDEPPQAMLYFMERNFAGRPAPGERRETDRVSLLATVVAIPLDDKLQPRGEAFKAAARDVSQDGISILRTRAVDASYLALRWQSLSSRASYVKVYMKVIRCRPMGPFYEAAGQFVLSQ